MTLSIGSTVWVYDQNRRVYERDENGRAFSSAPIEREHWCEEKIVSETSRSWVLQFGRKVPKKRKPGEHDGLATSIEEVEAKVWFVKHRQRVIDSIRWSDVAVIVEIARMIGYEPAPPAALEARVGQAEEQGK